ncbi:hypothetical protein RJ55_05543 [Drechmeria coniospora]|nr:hypothetical protein RJ55_05543 [Drechmeria coniospora]
MAHAHAEVLLAHVSAVVGSARGPHLPYGAPNTWSTDAAAPARHWDARRPPATARPLPVPALVPNEPPTHLPTHPPIHPSTLSAPSNAPSNRHPSLSRPPSTTHPLVHLDRHAHDRDGTPALRHHRLRRPSAGHQALAMANTNTAKGDGHDMMMATTPTSTSAQVCANRTIRTRWRATARPRSDLLPGHGCIRLDPATLSSRCVHSPIGQSPSLDSTTRCRMLPCVPPIPLHVGTPCSAELRRAATVAPTPTNPLATLTTTHHRLAVGTLRDLGQLPRHAAVAARMWPCPPLILFLLTITPVLVRTLCMQCSNKYLGSVLAAAMGCNYLAQWHVPAYSAGSAFQYLDIIWYW